MECNISSLITFIFAFNDCCLHKDGFLKAPPPEDPPTTEIGETTRTGAVGGAKWSGAPFLPPSGGPASEWQRESLRVRLPWTIAPTIAGLRCTVRAFLGAEGVGLCSTPGELGRSPSKMWSSVLSILKWGNIGIANMLLKTYGGSLELGKKWAELLLLQSGYVKRRERLLRQQGIWLCRA